MIFEKLWDRIFHHPHSKVELPELPDPAERAEIARRVAAIRRQLELMKRIQRIRRSNDA